MSVHRKSARFFVVSVKTQCMFSKGWEEDGRRKLIGDGVTLFRSSDACTLCMRDKNGDIIEESIIIRDGAEETEKK